MSNLESDVLVIGGPPIPGTRINTGTWAKCSASFQCSSSGAHAAAVNALVPASHRLDAWLGGAMDGEDSFPRTDRGRLPAERMLRAALTSRS
jgi:hypothetical protein